MMFTIPSIYPLIIRIKFSSGAEAIYITNSWAQKQEKLLILVIGLAVFKLVSMALVAANHRLKRKLQEERAMIIRMALLVRKEMKNRRHARVKIEEESSLNRKRQKELWRTVIVEERVELLSRRDWRRRSGAFFPNH